MPRNTQYSRHGMNEKEEIEISEINKAMLNTLRRKYKIQTQTQRLELMIEYKYKYTDTRSEEGSQYI